MRHRTMFAAFALCLVACRSDADRDYYGALSRHGRPLRTLYINAADEPEYLDPGLISEQAGGNLVVDLFEGLIEQHPRDLHPIQGVAQRYDKSDDNRIYRFYLREDARWSDGARVVAGDFVYAWQRVLRPETGSRQVALLEVIKNGALFSQSQLLVVKSTGASLAQSQPSVGEVELAGGTAVRLLGKPDADGVVEVEVFLDLPSFTTARPKRSGEQPARGRVSQRSLQLDESVLGFRARGDGVLEVELERPTPYFLELVSYHTYFPVRRDVIERAARAGDVDRWTRPEHIVVNGPFTLVKHAFRYELVFEQNPHYWGRDELKIDRVVWPEVQSYDAALALYKGAEIDYIGTVTSLPEKYIPMLRKYRDFSEAPWQCSYWYEFNVRRPPLDDVRVRHALNLAVDKRQLIRRVTNGEQIPASHFVPDYTGSSYDTVVALDRAAAADPFERREWQYHPERARELLREAGYVIEQRDGRWHARGFPSLELLYNGAVGATSGHPAIAVALQAMWRENLGISATMRNEEWKVALKNMRDGNYQVARLGWCADYNHPHSYLETLLTNSPNNWTNWHDEQYDALIARAMRVGDPVESARIYRQAELRALEHMPRLPLYFYTKASLAKPYLKGFYPNAMNRHPVHWMWIDPDWRAHPERNEPAYPPRELAPPGRIE